MSSAIFLPEHLRRIQNETFVTQVEFHRELPSTNDRAVELIAEGRFSAPLLILAERQTAGRGRGGNRWWSGPGALTFSLVLDAGALRLSADRRPQISLTAGLGVCQALDEALPNHKFGLKWPNDVFLGARKVCGILVDVPSQKPECLIVGIGINVNNSFQDAPEELRPLATSLADTTGERFDPAEVLIRVLLELARSLELLLGEQSALRSAWMSRCILHGRTVHLQSGPRMTVGVCRGIDIDGALLLETDSGMERALGGVIARVE
ncbi:MAG: biotin--[acetyl-CoA-carboxylase] ligase [Planctomycetaceae bacterium]